jgi:ribosome-binding protein aMBF1 (putative translation factor)
MVSKSQVGMSLQDFADDIGVMDELIVDGASEQTGPKSEFMKTVRYLKVKLRQTKLYSPWQNDAERKIGEVKK